MLAVCQIILADFFCLKINKIKKIWNNNAFEFKLEIEKRWTMKKFYEIEFNEQFGNDTRMNEGLRIVLVLNSTLKVWGHKSIKVYQKGDVFIINHREQFRMIENKDTLYMSLHLSRDYLKQYINDFTDKKFILKKHILQDVIYQQIINSLAMMGVVYIRKGRFYRLYIEQQLIDLLFIIVKYLPTRQNEGVDNSTKDHRLESICDYIDNHYTESITLSEIAKMVGLSNAYLSRYFTRHMGVGINHYVNQVRIEHCKRDLIHTNDTITQIAFKNGFTNSNMLIKYFKEDMHMTPTVFREKYRKLKKIELLENGKKETTYQHYLYYLSMFVNQNIKKIVQSPEAQKVWDVSLRNDNKYLKHYNHVIQIGDLEALLVQRFRTQLLEVKACLGLNHILIKDPIRVGKIINDRVESDELIPNTHPYMKIDECLNFLLAHQIGLGIEIEPPKSNKQFNNYYKELSYLLEHMHNTVINNNVLHIIIYMKVADSHLFQKMCTLFKHYFEKVTIVLNVNIDDPMESSKAKAILNSNVYHIDRVAFCANQNDMINFNSLESKQYDIAKNHITLQVNKMMKLLEVDTQDIPCILLNWNTLTGDTNLTNGEYFRAGIIFEQLIEINNRIDTVGYWLNYEIHQRFNHKNTSTQLSGIDLYHQFDGKRPAFFTSMFFKKLFRCILYMNDNCMVLGDYHHFQIVVWDAEHYNPHFTLNDYTGSLNHKEYQINITHAKQGTYKVKHLTLDKNHGALYKVWQQYNTQYGMDEETVDYVNRISYPKLDISEVEVKGVLTYHLKLLTNAIQMIEFRRYIKA